jgi:hypothetical protein
MARFHGFVGGRLGDDDEAEIVVGIDTDHGPWVTALIAAGYRVLPVDPQQSARFRARYAVSGAKSDACDAHVLADMVRTDSHQLREAAGDSPEAEGIKVLARAHKTLIWERTRQVHGCGTSCWSTSPPPWTLSARTWTPPTHWSTSARPRTRNRPGS